MASHRLTPEALAIRERILQFSQREDLLPEGERIIVAVSGGYDSMTLLALLHRLNRWSLLAAHCNFQLRGEESEKDLALVTQFCQEESIPLLTARFETQQIAKMQRISIQEAARNLRYQWFTQIALKHQAQRVVTAHHADDQAETMLFHLVRGSDIKGMRGIPARRGLFVRPMLAITRKEIAILAGQLSVPYREDTSNASEKYTRNQIRHRIIPQLKEINPAANKHIARAALRMANILKTLAVESERIFGPLPTDENWKFDWRTQSCQAHRDLARFWLQQALENFGFNPTRSENIIESLERGSQHASIQANGFEVHISGGHLHLFPSVVDNLSEITIDAPGSYSISSLGTLKVKIEDCVDWKDHYGLEYVSRGKNWAVLDAEQTGFPLAVNLWRDGDAFRPLGMRGRKKISDYLTDGKVPHAQRQRTLTVKSHTQIAWLLPHRIGHDFRLRPESQQALILEWQEAPTGSSNTISQSVKS